MEISTRRMKSYEARLARVELQHLIPEEHEEILDQVISATENQELSRLAASDNINTTEEETDTNDK